MFALLFLEKIAQNANHGSDLYSMLSRTALNKRLVLDLAYYVHNHTEKKFDDHVRMASGRALRRLAKMLRHVCTLPFCSMEAFCHL